LVRGSLVSWATSDRRSHLPKDWPRIRQRVLKRDGRVCRIAFPGCAGAATEVDHVVRGDDHSEGNLQAACSPCHRTKSSREGAAAKPRINRPAETHPALK
jgi:5-methylcytosine-specific restriction endonuclease McrA